MTWNKHNTPMLNRLSRYLEEVKPIKQTYLAQEAIHIHTVEDAFNYIDVEILNKKHKIHEDLSRYINTIKINYYQQQLTQLGFALQLKSRLAQSVSTYIPVILHQDDSQHIETQIECSIQHGMVTARVPISYQYDTALLVGQQHKLIQLKNIQAYSIYDERNAETHAMNIDKELVLDNFQDIGHHIYELSEHSLIYIPRSIEYLQNTVCDITFLDLSTPYASTH